MMAPGVLGGWPMPLMPYSAVLDVVASFFHFGWQNRGGS